MNLDLDWFVVSSFFNMSNSMMHDLMYTQTFLKSYKV